MPLSQFKSHPSSLFDCVWYEGEWQSRVVVPCWLPLLLFTRTSRRASLRSWSWSDRRFINFFMTTTLHAFPLFGHAILHVFVYGWGHHWLVRTSRPCRFYTKSLLDCCYGFSCRPLGFLTLRVVRIIGLKQEGVNYFWNIFTSIEDRVKDYEESIN